MKTANLSLILRVYSAPFRVSPLKIMDFLHALNHSLFLWINADDDAHPAVIELALFVAEYITAAVMVAVGFYLLLHHRRRRMLCVNVLLSLLLGMAAAYLIRLGWHHARPFALGLGTNFLDHSASSSFPSKHFTAVVSPLASMCLFAVTRTAGLLGLALSLPVAWSRIYLGVHWPLDMAGALLVGFASALAAKWLLFSLRWAWQKKLGKVNN